jgi:hypothetical protein
MEKFSFSNVELETWGLAMIFVCISIAQLLDGLYHVIIIQSISRHKENNLKILTAYLQGQVIRYVPGKVVGIISQSLRLKDHIRSEIVWESYFVQFVSTNMNGMVVIFATALYLYTGKLFISLLCLSFVIFVCYVLNRGLISRGINLFIKFFNRKEINHELKNIYLDKKDAVKVVFFMNLEWCVFILAWFFIPGTLSPLESISLAVLYASSTIVGALTIVMPGGMLVREASFLYFGKMLTSVSPELLLFYSILFRIIFSISEVFLYFAAEFIYRIKSFQTHT